MPIETNELINYIDFVLFQCHGILISQFIKEKSSPKNRKIECRFFLKKISYSLLSQTFFQHHNNFTYKTFGKKNAHNFHFVEITLENAHREFYTLHAFWVILVRQKYFVTKTSALLRQMNVILSMIFSTLAVKFVFCKKYFYIYQHQRFLFFFPSESFFQDFKNFPYKMFREKCT